MINFRPILLVVGVLLTPLGFFMLIPAILELALGSNEWFGFFVSAVLTLVCAATFIIANWDSVSGLSVKQAFILTSASWIALAAFAALPLAFSSVGMSYTDAFFESMSGLTTTGSTVVTGLDDAPLGFLLWRALLQWIGGIGIIVTSIAILPMLQIGGMQLFRMESSDNSENILPRAAQFAGYITAVYGLLTFFCALLYFIFGMSLFDSICHSMTTVATGGFANSDQSFGFFNKPSLEVIAMAFMVLGSLPFTLYFQGLRGNFGAFRRDDQSRWFLITLIGAILILSVYHYQTNLSDYGESLRYTSFNVISIVTGTGYASADYGQWGGFAVAFFFLLTFLGGCAGSTSCGVKTFRFIIIFRVLRAAISNVVYPNAIIVPRYNGVAVTRVISASVMNFIFLYAICCAVVAVLLNISGLDVVTSISAAATSVSNVGPGLGNIIGPSGSFADLSDNVKWILSAAMLVGRLELFTIFVLFTRVFWRA